MSRLTTAFRSKSPSIEVFFVAAVAPLTVLHVRPAPVLRRVAPTATEAKWFWQPRTGTLNSWARSLDARVERFSKRNTARRSIHDLSLDAARASDRTRRSSGKQ